MRSPFLVALVPLAALTLASCGNTAADEKPGKVAALSGRQEVVLRLAHTTEAAGDYLGAEKLFLQVVSQNPDSTDTHVELAEFYKRHHEDQKAIDSLKTALRLQPANTDIARELANTYINASEPDKAIVVLDTAIASNSRNPLLFNSRGVALDQIGSYHEAQKSYKTAFDLDPSESTMYKINLSMSYILEGSYDKAVALLRPMLNGPDAPPIARQNLALAYGLKGESENALKLGLQDLSTSEAEENVRFYRMLAQKHHAYNPGEDKPVASTVPASVINELFPENDPDDLAKAAAEGTPTPDKKSEAMTAAPVTPVAVHEDVVILPPPPEKKADSVPVIPASPPVPKVATIPAPPVSQELSSRSKPKETEEEDNDDDDDTAMAPSPEKTADAIPPTAPARPPAPKDAAITEQPANQELSSRSKLKETEEEDDDEDDEAADPSPAASQKMQNQPTPTIEELSQKEPSSGGNDNVIVVAPDETSLPAPLLKPDTH